MSVEHDDRILEAGLEEVLGGHYPPDLTFTILQTWEARQQAAARAASAAEDVALPPATAAAALPVAPPMPLLSEPEPPPRHGAATLRVAPNSRVQRDVRTSRLPLALAVSLLAVAVLLGVYAAWQLSGPLGRPLAQPGVNSQPGVNGSNVSVPVIDRPRSVAKTKPRGQDAAGPRRERGGKPPAQQQLAAAASGALPSAAVATA